MATSFRILLKFVHEYCAGREHSSTDEPVDSAEVRLPMKSSPLVLLTFALMGASCGSSPTSPAPPVAMGGEWSGTGIVTSVSGGDCFGPSYA